VSARDDDIRGELAALRRRAYGPDADIERDPAALARLIELEASQQLEAAAAALPTDTGPSTGSSASRDADPARRRPSDYPRPVHPVRSAEPPSAASAARAGTRWPMVVGGMAVASAVVFAAFQVGGSMQQQPGAGADASPSASATAVFDPRTREAYSLARDADAEVLLHIPLDGSFGNYVDLTTDGSIPGFPASGPTRWAALLGDYYGWELWIAGAAGTVQDEQCILLQRGEERRARCVPAALRETAALAVSVPYEDLDASSRSAFSPGQRVGFWWKVDEEVTVLIADQPDLEATVDDPNSW
jgi:hypothetical protein